MWTVSGSPMAERQQAANYYGNYLAGRQAGQARQQQERDWGTALAQGGTLGGRNAALAGMPAASWEEYINPFYRGKGHGDPATHQPGYDAYLSAYNAAAAAQGGGGGGGAGGGTGAGSGGINVLDEHNATRDRTLGLLENAGNAERADTVERFDQQAASGHQDLVNRGLAASTLMPTMRAGVQRDKSRELDRLAQHFAQLKAQYEASLGTAKTGYLERQGNFDTDLAVRLQMMLGNSPQGSNLPPVRFLG